MERALGYYSDILLARQFWLVRKSECTTLHLVKSQRRRTWPRIGAKIRLAVYSRSKMCSEGLPGESESF